MDSSMLKRLSEIISEMKRCEKELADWASDFLAMRDCDRQTELIAELKSRVQEYVHDKSLPPLPNKPDGSLHGIGFIYDGDEDDRVFVAINQLKDNKDIVAVAEQEGVIYIYSRNRITNKTIEMYGDNWTVQEYLPHSGQWV